MAQTMFIVIGTLAALCGLIISDLGCKKIRIFPNLPWLVRAPLGILSIFMAMFVVAAIGGRNFCPFWGWGLFFSLTTLILVSFVLAAINVKPHYHGGKYVNR